MSSGLNCRLEEVKPSKWFYVLENDNATKNAFDWREYATAFGPFPSEDACLDHLFEHHSNPGGYAAMRYANRHGRPLDPVIAKLIKRAKK